MIVLGIIAFVCLVFGAITARTRTMTIVNTLGALGAVLLTIIAIILR